MADKEVAIKVSGVGKTFQPQSSSGTIKEAFISAGRQLSRKGKSLHHQGEYTALKDISFEVNKGDFFGIVGRNGSGKSTLLKILAGVYTPSRGAIQVNGKLTPFIELGVGFNPELTGRDNVFLNGALLGFSRKQIEDMYDDIVNFAELHDFMDTKLKNYSSGMQVRLAFSVAIRAKSDILLIDEVLAVGDEAFQEKCYDYFDAIKDNNITVILVTHDMNVVKKFCNSAAVINKGDLLFLGGCDEAINIYHELNQPGLINLSNEKETRRQFIPKHFKDVKVAIPDKNIKIDLTLKSLDGVGGVGIAIFDEKTDSYCFGTNTFIDKINIENKKISLIIKDADRLMPGSYYLKIGIFGRRDTSVLEFFEKAGYFKIKGKTTKHGIINFNYNWSA